MFYEEPKIDVMLFQKMDVIRTSDDDLGENDGEETEEF